MFCLGTLLIPVNNVGMLDDRGTITCRKLHWASRKGVAPVRMAEAFYVCSKELQGKPIAIGSNKATCSRVLSQVLIY